MKRSAPDYVLVCNAGSSSLKLAKIGLRSEQLLASAAVDLRSGRAELHVAHAGNASQRKAVAARDIGAVIGPALAMLGVEKAASAGRKGAPGPEGGRLVAVGHRVVHGGGQFRETTRLTERVERKLRSLAELAPLHNGLAVQAIDAARRALPDIPHFAVFDTAFHATLRPAAYTYAIPHGWTEGWGLRRYGFHGLSHEYCAQRVAEMLGRRRGRLIIAHLGNGASISAIRDGVCIDTSMGFTPLDGLMMGTRSGAIDPGIILHVLRERGLDADAVERKLNHESGLLGVSGVSSDMREVLAAANRGHARAKLAVEIYVRRVQQVIGAMAAVLGGVDALVFTAGVGENAAAIRADVCANLAHLGVRLSATRNQTHKPDADVATRTSAVRVLVIHTREDLTILRKVRNALSFTGAGASR
jgi:acetate kinase